MKDQKDNKTISTGCLVALIALGFPALLIFGIVFILLSVCLLPSPLGEFILNGIFWILGIH